MLASLRFRDKRYEYCFRRYVERVLGRRDILGILVFGSIARGEEKPFPESDIDVLVVAENLPQTLLLGDYRL